MKINPCLGRECDFWDGGCSLVDRVETWERMSTMCKSVPSPKPAPITITPAGHICDLCHMVRPDTTDPCPHCGG